MPSFLEGGSARRPSSSQLPVGRSVEAVNDRLDDLIQPEITWLDEGLAVPRGAVRCRAGSAQWRRRALSWALSITDGRDSPHSHLARQRAERERTDSTHLIPTALSAHIDASVRSCYDGFSRPETVWICSNGTPTPIMTRAAQINPAVSWSAANYRTCLMCGCQASDASTVATPTALTRKEVARIEECPAFATSGAQRRSRILTRRLGLAARTDETATLPGPQVRWSTVPRRSRPTRSGGRSATRRR